MPALTLAPSKVVIGPSITRSFGASGGTSPYTYSVVPGGAGGSIDSDGTYTAPTGVYGVDTVKVTDSAMVPAISTSQVLVSSPLQLLCDILQTQMGLADGRVYLWDQKIKAPTDSGLFIAVSELNTKPFGNSNKFDSDGNQVQSVNIHSTVSIDIISRDLSALQRREEVTMALNSVYSEQQQEANSFRVFPLPSNIVNLSDIDGAAIPYRFNISVNMQYFISKTSGVPYFNDFQDTEVVVDA